MIGEVLVLNNDYEPLNVCNARRAINLVFRGKADVLHQHEMPVVTMQGAWARPTVVKLKHHVRRPYPELRLSRRSVFARDGHACAYCGATRELTIDHVIPRRLGGKTTWDNLVACCRTCNIKKGDKTMAQWGIPPRRAPRKPRYVPFISLVKFLDSRQNDIWKDYLPQLAELDYL
jgi:5-methylcytosine-specific restriction endonuclease McrA